MTRAGVTTVGHILDCSPDVAEHLLKEQIDVDALKLQAQQQLGVLDEVTVRLVANTYSRARQSVYIFCSSVLPFLKFL